MRIVSHRLLLTWTFVSLIASGVWADDDHGLAGAPLAVAARVDVHRSDPGGFTGQSANDPNQGMTNVALALNAESRHVPIGRGWDFAVDVETGWQPLFTMVKASAASDVTPAYVNGLSAMAGPRISHASKSTEVAAVGLFGAARLSSTTPRFGNGASEQTMLIAANDIAEWALAFSGGLDFRWYARDVSQVHLVNQPLTPLLHIYGGLKHDQRLRRDADLERFNDPTGRVYFGFDVLPFRASFVSIGGGFAMETALVTTDRLPSGYRIFVTAIVDVKAF